ncbi:MAG: O-antigen ligase family protein [Acidobacteria bacterium]|nr:O-antigen ligase family protein [Acidobacteriota bacterium]
MNPTLQIPARSRGFFVLDQIRAWHLSVPLVAFFFFTAHIPLALLMTKSPLASTVHALATLLVGLWIAGTNARPERVAYIVAYIAGAETLWRMTRAMVFWEFGKYALIAILLIAIVRSGRLKGPLSVFLYFLLLLPSLVLPMSMVDSAEFRNQVSFNLSGPLALVISTWFFSDREFSRAQIHRLFIALIGPSIGVATIALFDTLSAQTIYFSNNSNFITSGGFGPNQVSSVLGLAALLAFLLTYDPKVTRGLRLMVFTLLLIFAVQSAMTFSRGGLYTAGGAAIVATFYLIRLPRTRLKVIGGILLLVLVTNFILLPQLDAFTGGALTKRFGNTKLTGRDKIVRADLQAWSDNLLFGVGPGQAKSYRQDYRVDTSAHTEFSRMLAEHGVFGLAAIFMLLLMALRHLRRAHDGPSKAFTAAMISWSFFYMLTAAMRLAAPAFIFGLAAANILPDDNSDNTKQTK